MTEGIVKVGLSIGLTAIASFLIMVGVCYGDLKKGVEAYNETRGMATELAVIRIQLTALMASQAKEHAKIDNKLDNLLINKADRVAERKILDNFNDSRVTL